MSQVDLGCGEEAILPENLGPGRSVKKSDLEQEGERPVAPG